MSKDYLQHFHDLASVILSRPERDELYRSLRHYQRGHDTARLVDTVQRLLNTPERAKLVTYIRAPMSKSERTKFDKLMAGTFSGSQAGSISGKSFPGQRPDYLGRITMPPNSATTMERLVTISGVRGGSMGFSVRGGSEFGLGIYVSHVTPGSPASQAGLQLGDQVISANGVDLQCVANSGAVKVLSSSALLNLVVKRLHKVPEWKVARERVLWYDVSQRRVVSSPPVSEGYSIPAQPSVLVERRLVLSVRQDSDFIGLNIRGGKEYGIGIYISRVDPGGLASSNGLRPGDQIVRVNDEEFLSITHSDAVDALRSSTHLIVTFRSVGKYPVFKELYAEYTWSDTVNDKTSTSTGSVRGDRSLTGKPSAPKKGGYRKHTQRSRARESSVDLVPFSQANITNLTRTRHDSLDDLDQLEELDDGLAVNSKVYRPNDKDIMYRRSYEDSWRDIDAINDNDPRTDDPANSWSVDNEDSLGHFAEDGDLDAHEVDYTTFLEQSARRDHLQSKKTRPAPLPAPKVQTAEDPVIIETVIEEAVTSFAASSPPASSVNSGSSSRAVMSREEEDEVDGLYAKVSDVGRQRAGGNLGRTGSSSTASSISSSITSSNGRPPALPPLRLTNGSVAGNNAHKPENGDEDDALEMITSQIKTLEARKSHLGSYEINRVATSPKSPLSPDSSEKSKTGTWSSLKKKLKGSLRIKGSGSKQRSRIPSNFESNESTPVGSLRQKGIFERSFGSQLLNASHTERYNLSGMLEDHARALLTEDECKAVMRHLQMYQESKLLDRLVEMLLEILDKPEKKLLLVDIRNVISPTQLNKYDELVSHCNVQGYEEWLTKFNADTKVSQESPVSKPEDNEHRAEEFSSEDFKDLPETLEVIIKEDDDSSYSAVEESIDRRNGEEIVYISKHKNFLGLELMGGRDDPSDSAIRIKEVLPGGAANDDSRLQPGVEIAKVDGQSMAGLSRQEAESTLQIAFSVKSPINMGIRIRHSHL